MMAFSLTILKSDAVKVSGPLVFTICGGVVTFREWFRFWFWFSEDSSSTCWISGWDLLWLRRWRHPQWGPPEEGGWPLLAVDPMTAQGSSAEGGWGSWSAVHGQSCRREEDGVAERREEGLSSFFPEVNGGACCLRGFLREKKRREKSEKVRQKDTIELSRMQNAGKAELRVNEESRVEKLACQDDISTTQRLCVRNSKICIDDLNSSHLFTDLLHRKHHNATLEDYTPGTWWFFTLDTDYTVPQIFGLRCLFYGLSLTLTDDYPPL